VLAARRLTTDCDNDRLRRQRRRSGTFGRITMTPPCETMGWKRALKLGGAGESFMRRFWRRFVVRLEKHWEKTLADAEDRQERWIKVSIGLMRFEPHMMPLVQQLGFLDVRLAVAMLDGFERLGKRKLIFTRARPFTSTLHSHICGCSVRTRLSVRSQR